jgi:hypothetical protein
MGVDKQAVQQGTRPRGVQFVWWAPTWIGIGLRRQIHPQDVLATIYRWRLLLGWLEIRRWA